MAHTIANKVKGALVALFAACIAFAATPGLAAAASSFPGFDQGKATATLAGIKAPAEVNVYKVAEYSYSSTTNEFTPKFVDDLNKDNALNGLTIDDFVARGTDDQAATISAAAVKNLMPTVQKVVEGTTAALTFPDYGSYLIIVKSEHVGEPVYENTIVSVNPVRDTTAESGWNTELKVFKKDSDGNIVLKSTPMDENTALTKGISATEKDYKASVDTITGGETAYFQITSLIPDYAGGAVNRTYLLEDTMDSIFLNPSEPVVKLDETVLTEDVDYTYTAWKKASEEDSAKWVMSIQLKDSAINSIDKNLVVTYNATLSKDAVANEENVNTVKLTYSTDTSTTNVSTFEKSVFDKAYGAKFTKTNENGTENLSGAEFSIYKADDTNFTDEIAHATSDKDGLVDFDGALGMNQDYVLVETKAPAGYQKRENLSFTVDLVDGNGYYTVSESKNLNGKVTNTKNPVLPVTGGTGTVALTAAGVVLLAGAATVIVRSRKQN